MGEGGLAAGVERGCAENGACIWLIGAFQQTLICGKTIKKN
jgi:hypothetical protein